MERRLFFRQMGYGSAGLMILPNMMYSCTLNGNENHNYTVGIDGIMPIATILDCSALLISTDALNKDFRSMVTGNIHQNLPGNLSRLGSSIPFENDHVLDYFENMKNNWDPGIDVDRKKISLILGWFMIQPLKKSMSEVYRKLIAQGYHYDRITIYYDAYMLNQVSGEPDMEELNESSVQEFFNSLGPRMVTRLHTFKPDYLDGPGWVVRMCDWRIRNKDRVEQYGSLVIENDQEKYKNFIKKYNVYNPDDQLIKLIRDEKSACTSETVDKLILSDPGNSMYTKSIVQGYKNVIAAEQFFQGKSSLGELKKLL